MPRPTKEQLNKINKFSQVELKDEQVYVFQSLSADTLPIKRYGWVGEYDITMTDGMLNKLKKDYRTGVGLLASHNSNRLPFGRTFDAQVKLDDVGGENVKTLYIDHYMVTSLDGEPLRTEINGMTTQDIANHIEVGHTFDTSIGFSMDDLKCSICNHDLRDWAQCSHIPGMTYDVQDGDQVVQMRCNIVADGGEGIENSLVYAGAVNRALIQNGKTTNSNESLSVTGSDYEASVNFGDTALYNVDDIKNLPIEAQVLCFMSKGNMQVLTNTNERRDFKQFLATNKESETMSDANKLVAAESLKDVVLKEDFDKAVVEKDELATKLSKAEGELATAAAQVVELKEKLETANGQITELSAKAELAEQYRTDLIDETVKAGVAARGNAFNVERYSKYVATLSVDDIKEELSAFKDEFPATVQAAQVTAQETEAERDGEVPVAQLSLQEIRDEAAKLGMQEYRKSGGNLVELTEKHYAELRKKQSK